MNRRAFLAAPLALAIPVTAVTPTIDRAAASAAASAAVAALARLQADAEIMARRFYAVTNDTLFQVVMEGEQI